MAIKPKISETLARPAILHYVLPVVMLYLVIGTVAQKYIGLFEATKIFFSAPIIWLGFVPLPGLPVLIGLIFINLSFKLLFKSPWTWRNAGIIVTHIGVMLLLVGGLFTALFSSEGYIDLAPGQTKSFVTDYHTRVFVIMDNEGTIIKKFEHDALSVGQTLTIPTTPLRIEILEACRHCKIVARQDATDAYQGMAQHMSLQAEPPRKLNEENFSGLTFAIKGSDNNGVYTVLEGIPKLPKVTADDKTYHIELRREQRKLPFRIELLEFKREMHPGTAMAKAYSSRVRIYDGDAQWESVIRMNEPLRYKGYSLFQSSFIETPSGDMSVLAIVWNAGRTFPYLSGIAVCLGIILHLFARRQTKPQNKKQRRKSMALFTLLLLCFLPQSASAEQFDLKGFATLPVMHEGRVKPMDSFARSIQSNLSGKEQRPILWLTETLFNPALSENTPILKITNPDLLNMLELSVQTDKLYSHRDVSQALAKKQDVLASILKTPEEDWTPAQKDFIALQQNSVLLGDLLSSMTLFLPLSVPLPEDVPDDLKGHANKQLSYVEITEIKPQLDAYLKTILEESGPDLTDYSESQQAVAYISFTLANLQAAGTRSTVLRILPSENTKWLSPWEYELKTDKTNHAALFMLWQQLAQAYHTSDARLWNNTINRIHKELGTHDIEGKKLEAELLYNSVHPYFISNIAYALALLSALGFLYFDKKSLIHLSALSLGAGIIMHGAGILTRIYILERPPVSTLYESIIFVGLIVTIYGLVSYLRDKKAFWLVLCAALGVTLHLLGFSFDNDGDNLLMLTAVLNTNFWLATHVICITVGYAFCIITSLLAHYILIMRASGKNDDGLFKHVHYVALLSLLFAAVGTVLGGIWADQSWGRFWGWDPKENGALLIVLWLIWILHGRICGQMGKTVVLAGLAYLSVIVALSWFGVNLLSVGLHAYGFTDAAAWMLGGIIVAETIIIGALVYLDKAKNHPQSA